ncbi:MAG: hypothetical protein Q9190_000004 [Brigantiaea leucoxantha]
MASQNGGNSQKLLVLTTFAYRKPDMPAEDYHRYISEIFVPLSSDIMARHGCVRRFIAHNHAVPRELAATIADPYPVEDFLDYDAVITTVVSDAEKFKRMKQEPYWKEKIIPDWKNFTDTSRNRVTVGWLEERIRDGVIL